MAVTNATTVTNEIVGRGDGRPGQRYPLANRNVSPGTLDLAMQEDSAPTDAARQLDRGGRPSTTAGPFDSVVRAAIARRASLQFGDGAASRPGVAGRGGRIPPLVPKTGDIVALRYRYGGGKAGEVPVGAIAQLETAGERSPDVVNFVAATGGRDAETLEPRRSGARARSCRRAAAAVTAGDFEWIARQTPDVRVARAHIVPLRRPLAAGRAVAAGSAAPPAVRPALARGSRPASRPGWPPGAVTVVVVPDEPGPEPIPVPSFLRAVCRQLDRHRLVTTEVHVVPPQYCRLCNVYRPACGRKPGLHAQPSCRISSATTPRHVPPRAAPAARTAGAFRSARSCTSPT